MKSLMSPNTVISNVVVQESSSLPVFEDKTVFFEQGSLSKKPKNTLTKKQQKAVATILGRAFAQDSFMAYVLPDSTTRVQQLSKLFSPLIYASQHYGVVNVTPGDSGVLAWIPGQFLSSSINFLDLLRSGVFWLPWSVGQDAFQRFKAHDTVCEHALFNNAPKNFAYLWAVGVHPDHTGQGLGKKMINQALEQMRCQGYTTCWLRTENPKNVGLYEHLGFKQVHTEIPSVSGQQYWLMFQNL